MKPGLSAAVIAGLFLAFLLFDRCFSPREVPPALDRAGVEELRGWWGRNLAQLERLAACAPPAGSPAPPEGWGLPRVQGAGRDRNGHVWIELEPVPGWRLGLLRREPDQPFDAASMPDRREALGDGWWWWQRAPE